MIEYKALNTNTNMVLGTGTKSAMEKICKNKKYCVIIKSTTIKNPIKTRQYFVDRFIKGEWIESPFPTSTLKDAEEIAKHMIGRNNVTQTRVVSWKENGDRQIHRNYSHEGFVKNPEDHKNYFVSYTTGSIHGYFDGLRFTSNKSNAAFFRSFSQAKKIATFLANKNNIPVTVEVE